MNPPKNSIAIRCAGLLAALLVSQSAVAEPAGVVSDSTGPLLAKTASGSIKVLAAGSSVETSDTLVSRAGVYARVTLTDHSELALGPDTELAIEKYSFHDQGSQADSAALRLHKGSVRVTSGALGKRATDSFTLTAGKSTIDIHHSVFIATYIDRSTSDIARLDIDSRPIHRALTRLANGYNYTRVTSFAMQPASPRELTDSPIKLAQNTPGGNATGLNPGLYVQVLDGMINVSNGAGSQNFAAGQFGFTPSIQQPPVILPSNPGLQFTPPPSFSQTSTSTGSSGGNPGAVDCVVR